MTFTISPAAAPRHTFAHIQQLQLWRRRQRISYQLFTSDRMITMPRTPRSYYLLVFVLKRNNRGGFLLSREK